MIYEDNFLKLKQIDKFMFNINFCTCIFEDLKKFVAKKEDDNIDNSLDIYNAGLEQLNISLIIYIIVFVIHG